MLMEKLQLLSLLAARPVRLTASNLSGYGWGGGGGRELSLLFPLFLIKRQKTWVVVKEMFVLHLPCHDKLMIKTLHLLVKFLRS